MTTLNVDADTMPRKRSFMDAYIEWCIRWIPDSFFFCLGLTALVVVCALIFTDTPFYSFTTKKNLIDAWTGNFWALLAFTMQMTVLMVTGYAVAASPPVRRIFTAVAQIPKTPTQIIIVAAVTAWVAAYLHWGIGMMGSIMFGRELFVQAKLRGIKVHKPILVAVIFLQLQPGSEGLSGAAPLFAASAGYLKSMVTAEYKDLTPNFLSLADTVAHPAYILTLLGAMLISILVCLWMMPKDASKIEEVDDEFIKAVVDAKAPSETASKTAWTTPAEIMSNSRVLMYVVGGVGLAWCCVVLYQQGFLGLSLNTYNFMFLCVAMVLCGNPLLFVQEHPRGPRRRVGLRPAVPVLCGHFRG